MATNHIVKAFDEELARLRTMVAALGTLAVDQLSLAVQSMAEPDLEAPTRVIEREPQADTLEHQVEQLAIRVLALRQPTAGDLREVLAEVRIANELERICDHAENMAQGPRCLESRCGTRCDVFKLCAAAAHPHDGGSAPHLRRDALPIRCARPGASRRSGDQHGRTNPVCHFRRSHGGGSPQG